MSDILVNDIVKQLELLAPSALQEGYDNCGLITGDRSQKVKGVLVVLDCLEKCVDEAIKQGLNMIVAHHPIVFSGLKKLTGSDYVQRTIIKAIKNDIAIYAIHTNLDHVANGVNRKICDMLGLENVSVLKPRSGDLLKLNVFVPEKDAENVRNAMFSAGAGHIGNYSECSFASIGIGTFKAGKGAKPAIGLVGARNQEREQKIEVVLPNWNKMEVISNMKAAHPYEEVAYDLFRMENSWDGVGAGMVGDLPKEEDTIKFLRRVKQVFESESLRYTSPLKKKVQRIAVCGGSGSFLLEDACRAGADVFVSADFKYHQFFDADGRIVIADMGHYESERFTIDLLHAYLSENFTTFAVRKSEINTNPIKAI